MRQVTSNTIAVGIIKAVLFFLFFGALLWILERIYPVIIYIIISLILVLLGQPVKQFLMRRLKLSNTMATVTVITFFLISILLFIGLFIPLIVQQGESLDLLRSHEFQQKWQASFETLKRYLEQKGIDFPDNSSLLKYLEKINFSFLTDFIQGTVNLLGNLTVGLFSVLFITFFLLREPSLMSRFVLKIIPRHDADQFLRAKERIKRLMRRYVSGLILQISILFLIYNFSLHLIGVPNATIIALISALLNLIPYVGPFISLLLMILLSITSQLDNTQAAFASIKWILLMYAVAQLIDNFFTQPYIYSRSVQSHPLEIFLVILISGYLFGVMGMIVAVPSYTILKILFKEFYVEYKSLFFKW